MVNDFQNRGLFANPAPWVEVKKLEAGRGVQRLPSSPAPPPFLAPNLPAASWLPFTLGPEV